MIDHKGNVVQFKPVEDAEAGISRADTLVKRAEASLVDLERRLALVEAASQPPGFVWK